MMSARVAGVPMPFSCSTAAKSSSSICLPAFSISESSRASVMRAGGLVSSCARRRLEVAHRDVRWPRSAPAPAAAAARRPRRRRRSGSTLRQPGSTSVRARVRNCSSPTVLVRSTRSHSAGGWKAPRKRRTTRSKRRLSSPESGAGGKRAGRHDREVVGDAGVVEDARLVLEPGALQVRGRARVVGEALLAAARAGEGVERPARRRRGSRSAGSASRCADRSAPCGARSSAAPRRACAAPTSRSGGCPRAGGWSGRRAAAPTRATACASPRPCPGAPTPPRRSPPRAPRRRCGRPCARCRRSSRSAGRTRSAS